MKEFHKVLERSRKAFDAEARIRHADLEYCVARIPINVIEGKKDVRPWSKR